MSTPNPEMLALKVDASGAWQPGQTVKTPGTRLAWDCLAGWVQAWETLQRRRISSTRYEQESNHIRALPLEMIAEETSPNTLYTFLEIMASNSGNRPRKGERERHPTQVRGHAVGDPHPVGHIDAGLTDREHRPPQDRRRALTHDSRPSPF